MIRRLIMYTASAVAGSAVFCYGAYALFLPGAFDLAFAMILPIVTPLMIAPPTSYAILILYQRAQEKNAELQIAREEAERANRQVAAFLANLSHELRTPLNAIIGFSDVLRNEHLGALDPTYKDYAKLIHSSGEHLHGLINRLLDVSRIEAGQYEIELEPVDVSRAIRAAINVCTPVLEEHNTSVTFAPPPGEVIALADDRALRQILINLIGNAAKYSRSDHPIEVLLETVPEPENAQDPEIRIAVRDHGQGMTEDDIEIAFTVFGKASKTVAERRRGVGLGLPLSKMLAELQGGSLAINSQLGDGTTALLSLPADTGLAA